MKKKLLASVLTLVLASAMTNTAFAAPVSKTTDGGVRFTGEAPVTGVIDVITEWNSSSQNALLEAVTEIERKNPGSVFGGPSGMVGDVASHHNRGANVNFGSHDLATLEDGERISPNNADRLENAADIIVVNSQDRNIVLANAGAEDDVWTLSLNVSEFMNTDDRTTGLEGYAMRFYTNENMTKGSAALSNTFDNVTANTPRDIAQGVGGYFVTTLIPSMTVPTYEDAKAGEYKATITWELTFGPKA